MIGHIITVWLKELRETLREFNVLILSIGFPLLFYPLVVLGLLQLETLQSGRLADDPPRVALDVPVELEPLFAEAELDLHPVPSDENIARSVESAEFDMVIRAQERGQSLELVMIFDGSEPRAQHTRELIDPILDDISEARRTTLEAHYGLPEGDLAPFTIEEINVTPDGQLMASIMSLILPMMFLICMIMAGLHPTVELIVGERVRGTLETTMAAPIPRAAILAGKIAAIVTLMLLALVANGVSMGLTLLHLTSMFSEAAPQVEFDTVALLCTVPLILVTAVMIASLLLLVCLPIQTIKAGQNAASTSSLLFLLPSMAGVIPGIEFDATIAATPICNTAILLRDALNGEGYASQAWISLGVNGCIALAALALAVRITRSEHFLFGSGKDQIQRWRLILGKTHRGGSK